MPNCNRNAATSAAIHVRSSARGPRRPPSDSKEPHAMTSKQKPQLQSKPASEKPKPTASEKPKPTASEKPKPSTSEKPKPSTSEKPKPTPAIILFGLDQARKPRAASFTADQVDQATKAAKLMELHVLKVDSPELAELAAKLQAGRIYASGHGFVPPAQLNIYDRIAD